MYQPLKVRLQKRSKNRPLFTGYVYETVRGISGTPRTVRRIQRAIRHREGTPRVREIQTPQVSEYQDDIRAMDP